MVAMVAMVGMVVSEYSPFPTAQIFVPLPLKHDSVHVFSGGFQLSTLPLLSNILTALHLIPNGLASCQDFLQATKQITKSERNKF